MNRLGTVTPNCGCHAPERSSIELAPSKTMRHVCPAHARRTSLMPCRRASTSGWMWKCAAAVAKVPLISSSIRSARSSRIQRRRCLFVPGRRRYPSWLASMITARGVDVTVRRVTRARRATLNPPQISEESRPSTTTVLWAAVPLCRCRSASAPYCEVPELTSTRRLPMLSSKLKASACAWPGR